MQDGHLEASQFFPLNSFRLSASRHAASRLVGLAALDTLARVSANARTPGRGVAAGFNHAVFYRGPRRLRALRCNRRRRRATGDKADKGKQEHAHRTLRWLAGKQSYTRLVSRALFLTALMCAAPAFAETSYFAAIPDLPVAPGLSETENAFGTQFSSDSGDLVLAFAWGTATPESVARFYGESLSALGWSSQPMARGEEDLAFIRGRERLIVHIEPQGAGTYLRVRLIVRPASMNVD